MSHPIFGFSEIFLRRLPAARRPLVNRCFTLLQWLGAVYLLLQAAGVGEDFPRFLSSLLLVGLGLLVPVLLAFQYVVERQTRACSLSCFSRKVVAWMGYGISLMLALMVLLSCSSVLVLGYAILFKIT